MQKNNLCPLPNKVLVYEEIDTISQSIFNPKTSKKNINKNNTINKRNNNFAKSNNNIRKIINNNIYSKFQKYFEKNYNIFFGNILLKKFNLNSFNNKKAYLISNYYNIEETKIIFPKREFYYRHHFEFLERPNLISIYFNNIEREYGKDKLNEYLNQKKKENLIIEKEEINQKIFDINVLEKIENYSTTITQASNNEKFVTITPFEIFRRCEDDKKLSQKIKNNEINNNKDKDEKSSKLTFSESCISYNEDKDEKSSKLTFSESCISYYSKNVPDESLITVINGLSNKPKKYKQEEKKLITFFNKKKEEIQKMTKFNKMNNVNQNQRMTTGINKFIKKETKKEKRISNSNNKKNKKLVVYDVINQNLIKKRSSNSKKKSNMNYPSFNLINKRKEVFNLKRKSFKKKRNTIQYGDINKNINRNNLVSISINNIDALLNIFLTPENKNRYKEKGTIQKKQNKKNSALTNVNNIFDINNKKNSQSISQKKFKKIKKNKLYKSKSPLTRLFNTRNNEKSEENKNYKKRKSVLISEKNNNLLVKSMNFTNRRNYLYRNKKRQNNAITLSQNFDSIMKNLLK